MRLKVYIIFCLLICGALGAGAVHFYGQKTFVLKQTYLLPQKSTPVQFEKETLSGVKQVILTDVGLNDILFSKLMTDADKDTILVISPYASKVKDKIKTAKSFGFEVWGQIPVEHISHPNVDAGDFALYANLTEDENKQRLNHIADMMMEVDKLIIINPSDFVNSETFTHITEGTTFDIIRTIQDRQFGAPSVAIIKADEY